MIEQAFFIALLRASEQLGWLLLAMLLVVPLLRRGFGAACAYGAWLLVPLMLVVAQAPASRPGHALQALVAQDLPATLLLKPAAPSVDWVSLWAAPLLALWVAGGLACMLLLVMRQRRFMRSLSVSADGTSWRGPIGSGPALVGLWRPRLCLPLDFEQRFSASQQRLILAHEQVHRARGDNAWNMLALVVCVLQWFNPLVWLGLRALRIDQELSCDAAVLREQPTQVADYARALVQAQGAPVHGLPWSSWRSAHPLIERVSMLKVHATARRRAGLLMLGLVGLLGAGAVHALQSEPAAVPEGKADVRLKVDIAYSEFAAGKSPSQRWTLRTQLEMRSGQAVTLSLPLKHGDESPDEAHQSIEVTLSATPGKDGQWLISTQARKGEPWTVLAKPRLLTAEGTKAAVETGTEGVDKLRLEITPTRLHAASAGE